MLELAMLKQYWSNARFEIASLFVNSTILILLYNLHDTKFYSKTPRSEYFSALSLHKLHKITYCVAPGRIAWTDAVPHYLQNNTAPCLDMEKILGNSIKPK